MELFHIYQAVPKLEQLLFISSLLIELIRVEFWKYDPNYFACDGSVDPGSFAELFKDIHDERVQGELEDYLEDFKW